MNTKKVILLLWFVTAVMAVAAQPGGDPNGGGKPAPISGIEWLILGGGLFGAIRSYFKLKGRKPGT